MINVEKSVLQFIYENTLSASFKVEYAILRARFNISQSELEAMLSKFKSLKYCGIIKEEGADEITFLSVQRRGLEFLNL